MNSVYLEFEERNQILQTRARQWRLILDEEDPDTVRQIFGAYLRGRLTLQEARRVLGYPLGSLIDPFEGLSSQDALQSYTRELILQDERYGDSCDMGGCE